MEEKPRRLNEFLGNPNKDIAEVVNARVQPVLSRSSVLDEPLKPLRTDDLLTKILNELSEIKAYVIEINKKVST